MKYLIIFPLLCALSNCEKCHKSGTHLYEVYCDEFTTDKPKDCKLNNSLAYGINSTYSYKDLKIGGCVFNEVLQYLQFISSISSLDISFSGYTELKPFTKEYELLVKLNISHNEIRDISELDFYKIPNTLEIDFSYNKISAIGYSDFNGAGKLTTIHFSHNEISIIRTEAFVNLNYLSFLDFTNNSITYFGAIFRNDTKITKILLKENPIKVINCGFSQLARKGVSVYFPWDNVEIVDHGVSLFFHFLQNHNFTCNLYSLNDSNK